MCATFYELSLEITRDYFFHMLLDEGVIKVHCGSRVHCGHKSCPLLGDMSASFCKKSIWDGWIGCGSYLWKSHCATECIALRAVSGLCECSVSVKLSFTGF